MSFATGVIGGSGTNVWKPDPTLTPGAEGDPFAPFELGLTVTLDDRSFQVAQFCRIGADGLLIDATAAIVEGVTEAPTEENFWTNKTGVDLVEGDYAFLFGTIINGAAGGGGGGTVGPATTNQVAYFTGVTAVGGDAGFTYDASTDTATLVTALDVPQVFHDVTGGTANCLTSAHAITSGNANVSILATADNGFSNANVSANSSGTGNADASTTAIAVTGDASVNAHATCVTGNGYGGVIVDVTTGNADVVTVANTNAGTSTAGFTANAGVHAVAVRASATDGGTMSLVIDTGDDLGDANDVLVSNGSQALWGSVVFPDADPHVAGAGYWVAGVLTKSAG